MKAMTTVSIWMIVVLIAGLVIAGIFISFTVSQKEEGGLSWNLVRDFVYYTLYMFFGPRIPVEI